MAVTTDDSRMPVKFGYEHLCTVIKDVGTQTDDLSIEERDATREMKNDEEENINEKKMEERKNDDEINTYAENSEEKTEEKDDTEEDNPTDGDYDEKEEKKNPRHYLGAEWDYVSEEEDPDYNYSPTNSWDYVMEPDYTGPISDSQPCKCKRGKSYTPPGFCRRYKYRKTPKIKPTSLDALFELHQ